MGPLASLGVSVGSQLAGAAIGKLFGGGTSVNKQINAQEQMMRYQVRMQKELESDAIQRRMRDAKLAGVSPMAALGMSPSGGSAVVGGNVDFNAVNGDTSMGQNVGRAVAAAMDPMSRLNMRLLNAQISGQELDNDYKAAQIAKMRGQLGPAMPGVTTDGDTPNYKRFVLADGREFWGPDEDLGQMMENSPIHGAAVVGREFVHRGKRILRSWRDSWKSRLYGGR